MKTAMLMTLSLLASGCASLSEGQPSAEARLAPTKGSTATGTVNFLQQGDLVIVSANVAGLTPGPHGFHVHEKGDCSAPDATSAGGHFNPTAAPHGDPGKGPHHAGDMPMLQADASGNAKLTTELRGVTLGDEPNSVIGKAVVVHAAADDYKSQPAGNSGPRVACGVIARR